MLRKTLPRWGMSGKEQAAQAKVERDKRTHVEYKDHLEDRDVKNWGGGMTDEEYAAHLKGRKLSDFADKDGGVDFFEYAFESSRGVNYTFSNNAYRLAQKENKYNKRWMARKKLRDRNREDAHIRWETGHEKVSGFRVTGTNRRVEDQKRKEQERVEVEQEIVTRLPNPYKILALPPHASAKHAGDNYKKLAKQYHPDAPGGDVAKMADLNTAYELVKKIIKEGGPAKSQTASECDHEETRHTVKNKRKAYRTKADIEKDEEEELAFEVNPRLREEREEMRRMSYEWKTSTRAAQRRADAKAERQASAIEGGQRPLTMAEEGTKELRYVYYCSTVLILFIFATLPKNFLRPPRVAENYAEGHPRQRASA